ncbi:hypothetical protein HK097_008697 [Rhizophlyctis rosea]|uniref:Phytanoyl-CoA dioxygenase n=1 Tax=Rhizophlyctis rosea TaxID=64517 RepID=A0AAD5SC93_9FUNG|nr:hypothetical protein HK097_008697 [Rhizophlyctis rosea]
MRSTSPDTSPTALRQRLKEDGYLFIPDLFPRDLVLSARRHIVEDMAENGFIEQGTDVMKAAMHSDYVQDPTKPGPNLLGRRDLQKCEQLLKVVEHQHLKHLFAGLYSGSGEGSVTDDVQSQNDDQDVTKVVLMSIESSWDDVKTYLPHGFPSVLVV